MMQKAMMAERFLGGRDDDEVRVRSSVGWMCDRIRRHVSTLPLSDASSFPNQYIGIHARLRKPAGDEGCVARASRKYERNASSDGGTAPPLS
eukprot:scaffold992_cov175-Amphora_coffeaeformis.AAC.11